MPPLNNPLSIRSPITEGLTLVSIDGHESISQLFFFRLELQAANKTPIPFERLLGQAVTVTLAQQNVQPRYFSGIISRLEQGNRNQDFTSYRADLVPTLWLRTKHVQSRIFQQLSVPDILKLVLDGLDVAYQLSGNFEPRPYCTQYQESDFAFVSRLMEEEGIYYLFRHTEAGHQLVISNGATYPRLPAGDTIAYDPAEGGGRNAPRIRSWSKAQEVCAGSYTLWDHHFELTGKHLEGQANLPEAVAIGKVEHPLRIPASTSLEVFEYPGGYAHHYDGVGPGGGDQAGKLQRVFPESERVVRLRVQEEAARCLTIEGGSECSQLLPGHGFTLQGHFDADDAYLVTRVAHRARAGGVQSGGQSEVEYSNTFACLPARMSYRPARLTPRPLIAGMQTATVTGLEDQPTYLDKYGRVKVQFHWDRQGKMDASSSCWLRVAQLWAGKNWGAFFWPRVGHEVVVIFEEGNPDCPLVVGSVYNDVNVPPVNLPADSAIAGIKSCIFGGDPATRFNSIVFYDAQGAEFIVVHSHLVEMNNSSADKYTHTPSMSLTFQGSFP